MEKATEKQLSFINAICYELEINEPKNLTKEEASYFISTYIDKYNERKRPNEWLNNHGFYVDIS